MNYQNLDEAGCQRLRAELESLLQPLKEKGLDVDLGSMTYSPTGNHVGLRLKLAVVDPVDGVAMTREREAYLEYASFSRLLKMEWLDDTFRDKKKSYKVTGYKPGKEGGRIECEQVGTGRVYTYPTEMVRELMEAQGK